MATGVADGSIIIDTKINVNGVKVGIEEIKASISRITSATSNMGTQAQNSINRQANALSKLVAAYSAQETKVRSLADEMERYRNTNVPTQEYTEIQKQITETQKKLDALIERQNRFLETGGRKRSTTYRRMDYDITELTNSIRFAQGELRSLETSGQAFLPGQDTEKFSRIAQRYITESQRLEAMNNNIGASFQRLEQVFNDYQGGLSRADKGQKKVSKSARDMGKSHQKAKKGVASLTSYFKTILKYGLGIRSVYILINKFRTGVIEGFKNLTQYSDDTNKALSILMSAFTRLKNSFATAFSPLVEFVAPALTGFINLISQAVTWTAQFFAALTGKDTYVKAVKVEEDYGAALKDSNKELKEKEKANKKLTLSFDELIQTQQNSQDQDEYKPPTPDEMFKTEEVSNDLKVQAAVIKETLGKLFDPLKESWLENGPQVMDSIKNTFSAIKQLAKDVSASFLQVWNAEGYGKAITNDLLATFQNLSDTVGNLVRRFDEAWVSGDTGTSIIRHLGDIILEVTGFFKAASESLKNWSAGLDFSPLLKSFDRLLVSLKPVVNNVGSLLLWLLNNILEPLAKWGLEQALPVVFDLIAASLDIIHNVIEALKPAALWFWEEFLKPLGEWAGEIFIAALKKIVEWLGRFSEWISQHKTLVENMTVAILAFFAAWKFTQFVTGVTLLISKLGGFVGIAQTVISVLSSTISKINVMHVAIAAVVSVIAIVAKNWKYMTPTEKVISGILAAATAAAMLAVAFNAVSGAAKAALVAAGIAAGILAVTVAINAGKRSTSSYSGGGNYGGSSYPMSAYASVPYNPPMLATGTVVPPRAGISYFGIGDNNHEPEVISPISTIEKALENVLNRKGLNDNKTMYIDMVVDGQTFARAVYKYNNQERQRVGVRMVNT